MDKGESGVNLMDGIVEEKLIALVHFIYLFLWFRYLSFKEKGYETLRGHDIWRNLLIIKQKKNIKWMIINDISVYILIVN